jgi:hypothetical protein
MQLDFPTLNSDDNQKLRFTVMEMRKKNDGLISILSHANLREHLRQEQGITEEQGITGHDKIFINHS